jgi:serine/threonine protein kinase
VPTDERLYSLLDRWVAEADAGRLLSVAELCRDSPELIPEAEREVAVLRRFHVLARPRETTTVEAHAEADTTGDRLPSASTGCPTPTPVAKIGRYRIVEGLGQGGMGIVFKARDTQLNRYVALKLVHPEMASNPRTAGRFLREARAMAALRHDHVVEIYDYGELDGKCFVTMPLLAGETLESRLDRECSLPIPQVMRIGAELAEGLAAVHEKGLVHRDLKPSNVWLEAPNGRVKLLDFGLARDPGADDRVTRTGAVVGTPAYMSPEQVNGLDLDARSDLFSLGSILYKAATGRSAFAASTLTATLRAVGEDQPTPACNVNPTVPASLSELIERLHRKNPAERPRSSSETALELRRMLAGSLEPTLERRGTGGPAERLKRRKNRRNRSPRR